MKAHELAYKLRSGPDIEVVYVEEDREYGYHYQREVEDVVLVTSTPDDGDVEAPYMELQ